MHVRVRFPIAVWTRTHVVRVSVEGIGLEAQRWPKRGPTLWNMGDDASAQGRVRVHRVRTSTPFFLSEKLCWVLPILLTTLYSINHHTIHKNAI